MRCGALDFSCCDGGRLKIAFSSSPLVDYIMARCFFPAGSPWSSFQPRRLAHVFVGSSLADSSQPRTFMRPEIPAFVRPNDLIAGPRPSRHPGCRRPFFSLMEVRVPCSSSSRYPSTAGLRGPNNRLSLENFFVRPRRKFLFKGQGSSSVVRKFAVFSLPPPRSFSARRLVNAFGRFPLSLRSLDQEPFPPPLESP